MPASENKKQIQSDKNMRKNILLAGFLLTCLGGFAQHDAKARAILDKMATSYQQAGAVSIRFGGIQDGTLKVKGNKFYLNCGGIETWFDGTTQWSYVKQNDEVNVSEPSPEEVQSVNPYALVNSYKQGFNYRYAGTKSHKGKQGEEVILTPETEQDVKSITINVSSASQPQYICITLQNGEKQEFYVQSYQTKQNLNDSAFRFDRSKYPDAEIIDLR